MRFPETRLLLALLTAITVACEPVAPGSAPAAPSRSEAAIPVSPVGGATLPPAASPCVAPRQGSPTFAPDSVRVTTNALGTLSGDWVFTLRDLELATELWAVPLAGGPPRLALRFCNVRLATADGLADVQPYLRRAFSPDGRGLVIFIPGRGLTVVDLETGAVRPLGFEGRYPTWSRRGDQISFNRPERNPNPQASYLIDVPWLINVNGSDAHRIANAPMEWAPDGARYLSPDPETLEGWVLVETQTQKVVEHMNLAVPLAGTTRRSIAFWRHTSEEVALIVRGGLGSIEQVGIRDMASGAFRRLTTIVGAADPPTYLDPRFNPSGDELLFTDVRAPNDRLPLLLRRVHIVSLASGRDEVIPLNAFEATWTPDGTGIVFVDAGVAPDARVAVRLFSRADRTIRDLLVRAGPGDSFWSVVGVSY